MKGEGDEERKESSEDEAKGGAEAMQEDAVAAPRGTKRSVKERLGDRKVKLDRFKNETLAPPGEPRQLVDIAEISLVEGTDQDFGEEVAERLKEDKEEMMVDLVKAVGRRVVWEFYKDTQKIEREGGMVINNGARRRTAGGVMLHLLRKTDRPELKEKLRKFFNDSQKDDRRKILAAKKRKAKDFDKEMSEFLSARKKLAEKPDETAMDDSAEPYGEPEEGPAVLAPLPNVLSMMSRQPAKPSVTRVSSFKEPEAPPNSVERPERSLSPAAREERSLSPAVREERSLSPVSREERALLDYDEDDFLGSTNDTEDIELF